MGDSRSTQLYRFAPSSEANEGFKIYLHVVEPYSFADYSIYIFASTTTYLGLAWDLSLLAQQAGCIVRNEGDIPRGSLLVHRAGA